MKKKILSIVLALAMVLSFFPGMTITADASDKAVEWSFTDNSDAPASFDNSGKNIDNALYANIYYDEYFDNVVRDENGHCGDRYAGKYLHINLNADVTATMGFGAHEYDNFGSTKLKKIIIYLNGNTLTFNNEYAFDCDVTFEGNGGSVVANNSLTALAYTNTESPDSTYASISFEDMKSVTYKSAIRVGLWERYTGMRARGAISIEAEEIIGNGDLVATDVTIKAPDGVETARMNIVGYNYGLGGMQTDAMENFDGVQWNGSYRPYTYTFKNVIGSVTCANSAVFGWNYDNESLTINVTHDLDITTKLGKTDKSDAEPFASNEIAQEVARIYGEENYGFYKYFEILVPCEHDYEYSPIGSNKGYHTGTCSKCSDVISSEACEYNGDTVCDKCQYDSHVHDYIYTAKNDGTHDGACNCGRDPIIGAACEYDSDYKCVKCHYQHVHTYSYDYKGSGKHDVSCTAGCGYADTGVDCTYGDDDKCTKCNGEKPYEITLDATGLLNSDGAEIWFNPEGTPIEDYDYYQWVDAESTANVNLRDNDDSAVVLVYPEYPLAYQNLVVTVNGVPIESTFDDNNGLVFYIDEFTGDTTITITGEATEREFESFDSTLLQSETFDAIEDGDPLPDLGEAIESAWITLVGGSRLFRSHSSYLSATWLCAEAGSDETPYEVDHETANTSDYDYFVKITFPVIGTVFEVDEDAMTSDSIHIINEQGAAYDVVSFGFQGMEGTDNRDLFVAVVKLGEGGKAQVTNINVILDEDNVPTYTIGGTVSGDRITLGVSTTPETTDVLMAVGIPGVMLSETNYRDALDPGILEAVEQDGTKSYEEVLTILTGAAEAAGANVDPVWFAIASGLLNPDYKLKAEDQIAMVIAVGAVDEGEYELAQDGTITLNGNAVEGLREDPMGGTFIFCHVLGNPKPDGTTPPSTVPVTGVTLNKSTLSLEVNATETLTATVAPDDATDKTVSWESTDTSVATVNENGVVTAVAAGTATITAKAGDKIATCVVTVTAPPAHQHSYDYTSNNNGTHNGACECGKDAITNEACTYGDDGKCTKCGATKPNEEPDHEHEYTYTSNNDGTHNGACACGEDAITNEACSYDDKGVCSKCGYEKTYTISGNVTIKGEETPVPNAKVELKKGNTVVAEDTTDANGNYDFTSVPKGGYNIVVTTSDSGKTKTSHVKIENSDQTVNVEFPKGNVSSKVEVKENADNSATEETKLNISETVAVGVDAIAEQYESTLDSGKHVEVKLEVEPMADLSQADDSSLSEEQKEIKQEQSEIKNLAAEESNGTSDNEKKIEFLDLSLWMTETVDGVKQEAQNIGDNNSVILSIIIPFDTSAEGIVIYRCHNGVAEAMTNMTINFQDGQEGFVIGVGEIIIYARQFSTYAAAYDVSTPPVHQHSYSYTSNGNGTHNGACTCGEDAITNEACSYVGGACSKCGATKPNDPVIPNIPTNPSFMVSIAGTMNGGKVELSSKSATQGTTVTITVTPDKGYELETLTVIDFKGNAVALTNIGGGKYTFVMPMGQVSINATFVKKDMSCNKGVDCPIWPYKDASTTAWYHDGVHYSIENGLMNGLTTTQFAPNGTTTRAQIVTILWRLEGQPRENCNMSFTDVAAGQWYTEAVRWAALKGIVEGYSDTVFAPNDVITREQMAAILWRYCKYKGIDVSVGKETNILSYTDAFSVHSWAMPAMQWACGAGVIGGIADGNSMKLDPTGSATRAQVATMLWRFCTEIMNH